MESVEVASVSSKGQIVIPQKLREKMNIHTGEKFVVVGNDDTILLKKIGMPSFDGFEELLKKTQAEVKKKGIKPSDVEEAIKRVRKK